MSTSNNPINYSTDSKDFGWGIGNPMPGKKPEKIQKESNLPITKIHLYRDIFEATGLQYPSTINCPHCKGEDKTELISTPYGYLAQMPGYLAYRCDHCSGMVYIEPNTLFFCHPGTFITSLDILKQRFARFATPLAGDWIEKHAKQEQKKEEPLFSQRNLRAKKLLDKMYRLYQDENSRTSLGIECYFAKIEKEQE